MINSPLEQFNILSVYDFSLINIGNVEYITAKVFLWLWLTISNILNVIDPIASIYTTFLPFVGVLGPSLIVGFGESLTQILGDAKLIQMTCFIDFLYSIYHNMLSYFWFILYKDLNIIYSTDHSFLTKILNFFLDPSVIGTNPSDKDLIISEGGTNYKSLFIDTNIGLVSGQGVIFTGIYFMFIELWLNISSVIYQWTLEPLFNIATKDFSYLILSLNTSTLWLIVGSFFFAFILTVSLKTVTLIPKNNWQTLLESLYGSILNVVYENAGPKNIKYFPLIFTTFIVILMCNLLGMIPYSFTVTSHIIVTFSAALAIFIGMNILGIIKHGKHFLSLFFPPGAPLVLALLLVIIEFVSYVFRVFSLSIRLFANLMSGHTLLKILSGFAWVTVSFWGIFLIPIGIIFLITGLELMIACLQAYIFIVLLCIYINDAINLH